MEKTDGQFGGISNFVTWLCISDSPCMCIKLCFRKMTNDYISHTELQGFLTKSKSLTLTSAKIKRCFGRKFGHLCRTVLFDITGNETKLSKL